MTHFSTLRRIGWILTLATLAGFLCMTLLGVAHGQGLGPRGPAIPTLVPSSAVKGSTSGASPAAGVVGETLFVQKTNAQNVSLTTGTAADIVSLSLTAGNWLVCGNIGYNPNGSTTTSSFEGWINTASATAPTAPGAGSYYYSGRAELAGVGFIVPVGCRAIATSSTVTAYLAAKASFAVSTAVVYGSLVAIRLP